MTKIRQNSQGESLIHLTGITAGLLSFLHLKYAHPVSGVGLEGSIKGVAAGDLGRRWVWVGYVDEHHLGVGGCWGVCCCCCCLCCSCLCGALHADLKSASKQMKTDGETTCHDSDWWQQVPQDGLWYHREPHRCLYKRHSSCCCCFFSLLLRTYSLCSTCFQSHYAYVLTSKHFPRAKTKLILHLRTIPFHWRIV